MSDDVEIAYNKQDLRKITSALKAMGDEATDAAKRESSAIAEFAQGKIQQKAITTPSVFYQKHFPTWR